VDTGKVIRSEKFFSHDSLFGTFHICPPNLLIDEMTLVRRLTDRNLMDYYFYKSQVCVFSFSGVCTSLQ